MGQKSDDGIGVWGVPNALIWIYPLGCVRISAPFGYFAQPLFYDFTCSLSSFVVL